MNKTPSKLPILITGSHQSGTNWVAQTLGSHPDLGMIFEPFNVEMNDIGIGVCERMDHNFLHINTHNEKNYKKRINNLSKFQYPTLKNLARAKNLTSFVNILKNTALYFSYRSNKKTPIFNDPLAFFSAPWLAQCFDMKVVIMVRHPAAFCASLKHRNWTFNYYNFLNQEQLMDSYLAPYKTEIEQLISKDHDIIDQAILIWNCIHHTALKYKNEHNNWIFLRHEDISYDPINQFSYLCEKLNLSFHPNIEAEIIESQKTSKMSSFKDGRKDIKNWKSRLTENEINRVKDSTQEISKNFYHDSDW